MCRKVAKATQVLVMTNRMLLRVEQVPYLLGKLNRIQVLEVSDHASVEKLPGLYLKPLQIPTVLNYHDQRRKETVGKKEQYQVRMTDAFRLICVYEIVDREKDINESVTSIIEQTSQPPKRPRINRNRYPSSQSHALAKKLLPIDPQAGDKSRSGRKD
jgi:hypothetical protein